MQKFDEKLPAEQIPLTFDFSSGLAAGETLTGTPTVAFATLFGTDASPSSLANGAANIDPTGTLVLVPVTGGLDQNDYVVTVTCPTTNAKKTLSLPGVLPVRLYPSKTDDCGC